MLAGDRSGDSEVLRDRVYRAIRLALVKGQFVPGQKVTIRRLAADFGTSVMPVREALRKLVAEGALEGVPNRSVRIPILDAEKIREIRDIRIAVEGLAAERAAVLISAKSIAALRRISAEINAARDRGDTATDIEKVAKFQFMVYEASQMPRLVRIIESLWLQTGPYINLLYPEYVSPRRGEWRVRLCAALERRNGESARREISEDVRGALDYVASLIETAGRITSGRLAVATSPRMRDQPSVTRR